MPRTARVVVPHFPHHITQRGAQNQNVFFSDNDKQSYIKILLSEIEKSKMKIWAYCIMTNHVHFIAVPSEPKELSFVFGRTHRKYAKQINQKHGWQGHLWQERFHSFVMDESYLYAAIRYVENNPVSANITQKAEDYPWSSARRHIFNQYDPLVNHCFLEDQIQDWRSYLRESTEIYEDQYRNHIHGKPLLAHNQTTKLGQILIK